MATKMICIKNGKIYYKAIAYMDNDGDIYDTNFSYNSPIIIKKNKRLYSVDMKNVTMKRNKRGKMRYEVEKKYLEILNKSKIYSEEKCVICGDKEPSFTYYPCNHNCVCKDCDIKMRDRNCPLCRRSIMVQTRN
tara:strand:+ start:5590 stop:5991 length:402 start_codon:yes stop_codon:yes gene_type:complete